MHLQKQPTTTNEANALTRVPQGNVRGDEPVVAMSMGANQFYGLCETKALMAECNANVEE